MPSPALDGENHSESNVVAEWIHFTLFWENIAHYKTKSVRFWGLMNSATKVMKAQVDKPHGPSRDDHRSCIISAGAFKAREVLSIRGLHSFTN